MRHCDFCCIDYTGELDRCPLCARPLEGEATPSPFPVSTWYRVSRTVHRALVAAAVVLLAAAAIVAAAFGVPALLIALVAGIVLYATFRLLLTQGPLRVKLSKFFSLK